MGRCGLDTVPDTPPYNEGPRAPERGPSARKAIEQLKA